MSRYRSNNKEMYNSRYNHQHTNLFDKNVWGPKMWEIMHTFSFSYPIYPTHVEKQSAHNFYTSIGILIPCKECSQHCLDYVKSNPPHVQSKNNLIDWVYTFHNEVNIRLGKPHYSKQDLLNKYEDVSFCNS